jgi:hypothetical protein
LVPYEKPAALSNVIRSSDVDAVLGQRVSEPPHPNRIGERAVSHETYS